MYIHTCIFTLYSTLLKSYMYLLALSAVCLFWIPSTADKWGSTVSSLLCYQLADWLQLLARFNFSFWIISARCVESSPRHGKPHWLLIIDIEAPPNHNSSSLLHLNPLWIVQLQKVIGYTRFVNKENREVTEQTSPEFCSRAKQLLGFNCQRQMTLKWLRLFAEKAFIP